MKFIGGKMFRGGIRYVAFLLGYSFRKKEVLDERRQKSGFFKR